MGAPYTSQSVSNYNSNPPPDDGTVSEANRGKWATIKTKLTDPLNSFASAVNSAISTAFGRIIGGAGITDTAVNYTVQSSDQGKLVRATADGITVTTPDATSVGSPFLWSFLNNSSGDVTLDGSGSQTIDGSASITFPAGTGAMLWTNGTNWFTDGQNFQRTLVAPQGYLTLLPTATDPLNVKPTSNTAAATSVYYRPDKGVLLPIPDGTNISVREFSELTLTLNSNHVASGIYDVFGFDDAGTIRIGTGPVWNTVTAGSGARGTGAGTTELTRFKGLMVNNVAVTMRNGATTYSVSAKCGVYLGSLYIDGSAGQVTCNIGEGQSRKWSVWNAYNQREIVLLVQDSTASWSYTTATWRQSRATAGNTAAAFCGLREVLEGDFSQFVFSGTGLRDARIAFGLNSTSVPAGKIGGNQSPSADAVASDLVAKYVPSPLFGLNNLNALEMGAGAGSQTFSGSTQMLMSVKWMG